MRLRERLKRAGDELGLRIEFDPRLSVRGALDLTPVARLLDFGADNGMLIFVDGRDLLSCTEQLLDAGFGYSVLGDGSPTEEFDLESFKEMSIDWGWSGCSESKPAWMPAEP